MKLHRNAKSTPTSRALLVRRVLVEGWSYAQAAEGLGVSIRTVAKWVRRFKEGGVAALEDASSRPGAPPHQTPPGAIALIRVLRQQHALPAWAIGRALRIPRSTVSAWLRRLGLQSAAGRAADPGATLRVATAGDLLHVDIKPLGRIGQIGHRIHGDRRRATPGIGWEYVHVAIDDHSRLAYVEVLGDQLGTTCAAFLQRAVAWLQARGIPTRRVMSACYHGLCQAPVPWDVQSRCKCELQPKLAHRASYGQTPEGAERATRSCVERARERAAQDNGRPAFLSGCTEAPGKRYVGEATAAACHV